MDERRGSSRAPARSRRALGGPAAPLTTKRLAGRHGVTYGWDDALVAYKESAMYYLSGAMSLIGTFDAGNERGAALVEAYSTRILNHCVDIDAGNVL